MYCCLPLPEDKNYFALIVKNDNDESHHNENSDYQCYLFVIDQTAAMSHWSHLELAKEFGINCTADPITGNCLEFPGKFFLFF